MDILYTIYVIICILYCTSTIQWNKYVPPRWTRPCVIYKYVFRINIAQLKVIKCQNNCTDVIACARLTISQQRDWISAMVDVGAGGEYIECRVVSIRQLASATSKLTRRFRCAGMRTKEFMKNAPSVTRSAVWSGTCLHWTLYSQLNLGVYHGCDF